MRRAPTTRLPSRRTARSGDGAGIFTARSAATAPEHQCHTGQREFTTTNPTTTVSNDWMEIKAGQRHSVALKKNGTIWVWGDNTWGQLGITQRPLAHSQSRTIRKHLGFTRRRNGAHLCQQEGRIPLQLGPQPERADRRRKHHEPVLAIPGGCCHSGLDARLHAKSVYAGDWPDGTLWGWGNNTNGTLGLGHATSPILTPATSGQWSTGYFAFGDPTVITPTPSVPWATSTFPPKGSRTGPSGATEGF